MTLATPQLLVGGSAVGLMLLAAYSIACDLVFRDRERLGRRMDEAFRQQQRERAERSLLFKDLARLAEDTATAGPGLRRRFEVMIEQSGLRTTPRAVLTTAGGAAVALGALTALLVSPLAAIPAALVGLAVPVWYVRAKRDARRERLRSQLPDAFDLMARSVRAGQTMQQALLAVAEEFPPPIAEEFALCSEQQNLGLSPDEAYQDLAERTDLVEIKLFVTAAAVQQQTGGNLTELLDRLAALLRDRARIRGVVKTLTAEGRLQAVLLMALPPGMFAVMMVLNASYARLLFEYPKVILVTLGLETVGALWIRKIVNFDF
jgi:tight adherence protein B